MTAVSVPGARKEIGRRDGKLQESAGSLEGEGVMGYDYTVGSEITRIP